MLSRGKARNVLDEMHQTVVARQNERVNKKFPHSYSHFFHRLRDNSR